jgi:hypothetical protein
MRPVMLSGSVAASFQLAGVPLGQTEPRLLGVRAVGPDDLSCERGAVTHIAVAIGLGGLLQGG